MSPAHLTAQMHSSNNAAPGEVSESDIVFQCSHCAAPLVVNAAAAGLTVACQSCGKPTVVPNPDGASTAKISDLQHQLKENESQRTEITGYINQLSIQLHRWQLRLQTLNERQAKLRAELSAVTRK